MIRDYDDSDIEDVLDVWYHASLVAHPFLSHEFLAVERERIRNVYLPATRSWVHDEGGRVLGFISMMGNEVGAIFVSPALHGRGIGRGLLNTVRALHDTLEVEVFEENAIGRAFYERCGFELMHRHPHEETGEWCLRLTWAEDA